MCDAGRQDIENCEIGCQEKSVYYTNSDGFLIEKCSHCGHYTIYHKEDVNWINGPNEEIIKEKFMHEDISVDNWLDLTEIQSIKANDKKIELIYKYMNKTTVKNKEQVISIFLNFIQRNLSEFFDYAIRQN